MGAPSFRVLCERVGGTDLNRKIYRSVVPNFAKNARMGSTPGTAAKNDFPAFQPDLELLKRPRSKHGVKALAINHYGVVMIEIRTSRDVVALIALIAFERGDLDGM